MPALADAGILHNTGILEIAVLASASFVVVTRHVSDLSAGGCRGQTCQGHQRKTYEWQAHLRVLRLTPFFSSQLRHVPAVQSHLRTWLTRRLPAEHQVYWLRPVFLASAPDIRPPGQLTTLGDDAFRRALSWRDLPAASPQILFHLRNRIGNRIGVIALSGLQVSSVNELCHHFPRRQVGRANEAAHTCTA